MNMPVIHSLSEARQSQLSALEGVGIELTPPIVAPGTELDGAAIANRDVARRQYAAMPPWLDGAKAVVAAIRAEQREDVVVNLKSMCMTDAARLSATTATGSVVFPLEERGLYTLCARLSPVVTLRSFDTLYRLSPILRSAAFNHLMLRAAVLPDNARLKLRTRVGPNGVRAVYAVVGRTFTEYDAADYLSDVVEQLGADAELARGWVSYDPSTTRVRFNAVFNEIAQLDAGAGDVYRLALVGVTRDDAGARYEMHVAAHRDVGLQQWACNTAPLVSRVHRGPQDAAQAHIVGQTGLATAAFHKFMGQFGAMNTLAWNEAPKLAAAGKTFAKAMATLCKQFKLDADVVGEAFSGVPTVRGMLDALLAGAAALNDDDVLNAVTSFCTATVHGVIQAKAAPEAA